MPAKVMPPPRGPAQGSRRVSWRQTMPTASGDLRRLLENEPTGVESAEAAIDVVVVDSDGEQLHRIPVHLTSRVRGAGRTELWGSGEEGRLSVHVALDARGRVTVQLRVTDQPAGARESLHLLDVVESLVPPHGVAIVPAGARPDPVTTLSRRLVPRTPDGLRVLLQDLALIEGALGERIRVPDTFTRSDRHDITTTAGLLRGTEVTGSWTQARWPMTAAEARELRAGVFADGGEAQLDFETEWQLTIGDDTRPVGLVRVVHESAVITGVEPQDVDRLADDSDVVVTLGPRSSSAVRYRLVHVHARSSEQPVDQRWFWTEAWQARERAVDVAVAEGRVSSFATGEDFLAHLDGFDATVP